jgi:hypothetical protein
MRSAMRRILSPLVRASIARGLRYPELIEILKEIYVEVSGKYFRLSNKRLTDSRISLLTGLQRKDVKALRGRVEETDSETSREGSGLLPQVMARWTSGAPFSDPKGIPKPLPRVGETQSFASLVAEVSRDVHPRTVLDELVRLELAEFNKANDEITLLQTAFVPSRDEAALLGYFGANLGDHAEIAALNIEAAPEAGPFFERAVHYNQLTGQSLDELEALARQLQGEALAKLNARSLELQTRDADDPDANGRFRCGAFIFRGET